MELVGTRIALREFGENDVDSLLAVHSDPRLLRFYPPEVGTRRHAQFLVDAFTQWAAETPRQNFQLAIIILQTGVLVGSCGLRQKGCPPRSAEFGIAIDAEQWGRGIAQEAARLILQFGFSELQLEAVHGVSVSQNEAVAKLVRALGFSAGHPRPAEAWMAERGWDASTWTISSESWRRAG